MSMRGEVRGPGLISPVATLEYRSLVPGQRLMLVRERDNPVDPNAIILATEPLGQPVGYLAKEVAARIAADVDRGVPWRCAVTEAPNAFRKPQVKLWKERG